IKNYVNKSWGSYTKEDYFMHEAYNQYVNIYNYGKGRDIGGSEASDPLYKKGEGWTGTYFGSGTSFAQFTASVESRFYNNSGPAPLFKYVAVGANDNLKNSPDHRFKVYVSNDNFAFREINDTSYDGYSIVRKTMSLQPTDIGGNNTFFKFEGQFLTGIPSQANAVSSVSVLYPRNFDLDGNSSFRFNLQGNNTPRLIEWNNYSPGKTHPLVYDFTNNVRIRADKYTGTAVR